MAGITRSWGYGASTLSGVMLWMAAGCVLLGLIVGLRGGGSGGAHGAEDEDIPWEVRKQSVSKPSDVRGCCWLLPSPRQSTDSMGPPPAEYVCQPFHASATAAPSDLSSSLTPAASRACLQAVPLTTAAAVSL